jgi:adenosylcobinamide-phosphate synthase
MSSRALGLLLGFAADRVFGDPQRLHPVAGFGRAATWLERRWYADSRGRGSLFTLVLVGGAVALGSLGERATRGRPVVRVALVATCTWAVLGSRSLDREAHRVRRLGADGDLPGARRQLTHLVGRDTSGLDEAEVARAVVESVAENTADAVVAPLLWGAVAGVPGLLGYRAANTLDAMVGHHSDRYERFGWASARLDDLVNLPASRLTGLLGLAAAPGRARGSWWVWRRDARSHPSPNAGIPEAVFAGALGVRLGGTNRYGDQVEQRARLGDGGPPGPDDIARAVRVARRVDLGAVALCAASCAVAARRGPSRRCRS